MRTLIVVSSEKAGPALCGLTSALMRANHPFDCFVTGRGVAVLSDEQCVAQLSQAERAVVCEKSWADAASEAEPPIESGSQTNHSAFALEADHILCL